MRSVIAGSELGDQRGAVPRHTLACMSRGEQALAVMTLSVTSSGAGVSSASVCFSLSSCSMRKPN